MPEKQIAGYSLQPVVDLHSGSVIYNEMLVRFADGLNVEETILRAERDRSIGAIDLAILQVASKLLRAAPLSPSIAVNLSPVSIEEEAEALQKAVIRLGDDAKRLVFEITETAPIMEPAAVRAFVIHRSWAIRF
jgi:EAL domain-containing protein (putative c-di-GMP-specific phosphodiesterase class I)